MNRVSKGTFSALRPFYVRTETEKDIEMCCCKTHLHARWAVEALVECASIQKIELPFTNYTSFFVYLTTNCGKGSTSYIPWTCTPNNKTICDEIRIIWVTLSDRLKSSSSQEKMVDLTTFKQVEYKTKKGEITTKSKPVPTKSSMTDIISFINSILANTINHRNHLRHYRNAIKSFHDSFDAIFIDIDFSENLKLPVRWEPQEMHWCYEMITVHSAILKLHGDKSYHPYVSDDKKHDQPFVRIVLEKMFDTVDSIPQIGIIESDNCSSQYKSAEHFEDCQCVSTKLDIPIIRVYSVAGHGKGEVDHVGGLAKCAIRRYVGARGQVLNANDALNYLQHKFGDKSCPQYVIKEITIEELENARAAARLKTYPTIYGSDNFQVIVFKPNATSFKAAPYLCICETCLTTEYGSCELFSTYELRTGQLNKIRLRSQADQVVEETQISTDQLSTTELDFVLPNTYCAVLADSESEDFWFIKITDEREACEKPNTDGWGVTIPPGQSYIEGTFVLRSHTCDGGRVYKPDKRKTFFYPDVVVYPFVQFKVTKRGLLLSNEEYTEIVDFVKQNKCNHI